MHLFFVSEVRGIFNNPLLFVFVVILSLGRFTGWGQDRTGMYR